MAHQCGHCDFEEITLEGILIHSYSTHKDETRIVFKKTGEMH